MAETEILSYTEKTFPFCFGLKMPLLGKDWGLPVCKRKTWEDEVVKIISFLMAILKPFSFQLWEKLCAFPVHRTLKQARLFDFISDTRQFLGFLLQHLLRGAERRRNYFLRSSKITTSRDNIRIWFLCWLTQCPFVWFSPIPLLLGIC